MIEKFNISGKFKVDIMSWLYARRKLKNLYYICVLTSRSVVLHRYDGVENVYASIIRTSDKCYRVQYIGYVYKVLEKKIKPTAINKVTSFRSLKEVLDWLEVDLK